MKQIFYNKDIKNYISKDIIGKYIYYKEERQDSYLYYICYVKDIDFNDATNNIIYYTNKCYLLFVPKNKDLKAFVYDNYDKINISVKFDLYELTFTEFVNTFRTFIDNDGKQVSELPSKIIQDEIY